MHKSSFDIFSIGHSTHSRERFLSMLFQHGVNAVADVRSSPFSRHYPHFSQNEIKKWLRISGISYVFLGKELGGRPSTPELFNRGIADYDAMAATGEFADGLDRLIKGSVSHRVAMMCSEHEPLDCHRCLLVARRLSERGLRIGHILSGGEIASHEEMEERLLKLEGLGAEDLFRPRAERLTDAYQQRNLRVAFSENISSANVG